MSANELETIERIDILAGCIVEHAEELREFCSELKEKIEEEQYRLDHATKALKEIVKYAGSHKVSRKALDDICAIAQRAL